MLKSFASNNSMWLYAHSAELKIYTPTNYFTCICGFSLPTHKGIISVFIVLIYGSQAWGLIKVGSCYLHQVWTVTANQKRHH